MTPTTTPRILYSQPQLRRLQTLAYFASFVCIGMVAAAQGPALQMLARQTGTQLSQVSIIFTAMSFGFLLGSLASGYRFDRVRAHPLMAATTLLFAGTLALAPLTNNLMVLALAFFLVGVGMGVIELGANTAMVWVYRDQVGPQLTGLHFFFGVGALLSPVLVAQTIARTDSIAWAYWGMALLAAPLLLVFLRLPSPSPLAQRPRQRQGNGQDLLVAGLITLLFGLYVGAEVAFGGWIYSYATLLDLADTTTAGYLTSLFWGALTVGRLLSIPLAARVRPAVIFLLDLACLLLALTALALWPAVPGMIWAATAGIGLAMASVFPTMLSLADRYLTLTGKLTGWFLVGSSLGAMILPWLIGQLQVDFGPRVIVLAILITVVLLAAVFAITITIRRRSLRGSVP